MQASRDAATASTSWFAQVVSGGQTGVDRAALDVAIELGIPHGGWCPRGRLAEDGEIPHRYALREHASDEYPKRTEQNVVDSDGTLILFRGRLMGGTKLTRTLAKKWERPFHEVELQGQPDVTPVVTWCQHHQIATLNVAGPRESSALGIGVQAQAFLRRLFRQLTTTSSRD